MFKINAAITLAGLLLAAHSLQAQTLTLVTDSFDSGGANNGLPGRKTDTGNVQWIGTDFSTSPQAWGSGNVAADYSGNDNRAIGLPLSSFTLKSITTVSALLFNNKPNQIAFGFSGTAPGTYEANGGLNSGYLGFVNQTNGLALLIDNNGNGSLNYSGNSIATINAPTSFVPGAANTASVSFNSSADTVTVSLAGTIVLSGFDLSFFTTNFTPNYAGFGEFYGQGWNGSNTTATGFDNFSVATVPEPSTYAASFLGLGLLIAIQRKRIFSARA